MAHDDVSSLRKYPVHARAMAIAPVSQDDIVPPDRNAAQRFPTPGIGYRNKITCQGGQLHSVMNPPVNLQGSGLLNCGGIHNPPTPPARIQTLRPALMGPQLAAQVFQPTGGSAQTLEQRHVRKINPAQSLGSHHGLAQRQPSSHVQQDQAQQHRCAFDFAAPAQSTQLVGALFPVLRQKALHNVPVLGMKLLVHNAATINHTHANVYCYVSPYGPAPSVAFAGNMALTLLYEGGISSPLPA